MSFPLTIPGRVSSREDRETFGLADTRYRYLGVHKLEIPTFSDISPLTWPKLGLWIE